MQYLKSAQNKLIEAVAIIDKALSSGKLPTIERDILLAKLAETYEEILLEKEPATAKIEGKQSAVSEKPADSQVELTASHSENPKTNVTKTFQPQSTEPTKHETKSDKIDIKPTPKPTPPPAPQSHDESSAILADKYQGKRKFRNEVIAEQQQKVDMQSKLQNKPITDLAKAIGINDKFLFIKELFGGDADLYNQTIKHINQLTDLNEAIIYIHENFEWEADNETAMAFIDLVRRKFA
ncbi:MAG TPA: hypothetical protein ENN49_04915 [Bacteroidales bacterium]|nr:hypothetical protein [Bacteroidales bacterium]